MARIPLAEIPGVGNVPGAVVADYPGYRVQTPDIGPGPGSVNGSLSRIAEAGMQKQVSPAAFAAPGQAMEQAGYAVGKLAQVTDELSSRMAEAKNASDITKAQMAMENFVARTREEALSKPEGERELHFTNQLPKLQEELDKINPSPMAAERIGLDYQRTIGRGRAEVRHDAVISTIETGRGHVFNAFEKAMSEGKYEEAEGHLDRGVNGHLISTAEKEKRMTEAETQQRMMWLSQSIEKDPWAIVPELEKAARGESSNVGYLSPIQAKRFLNSAKAVQTDRMADISDSLDQAILQGKLTTEKEVREWGANLPARRILAHLNTLKVVDESSPKRQAEVIANRPVLRAMVENYNPGPDTGWEKYYEVKDEINSRMPEGERKEFLDLLAAKRRGESKAGETAGVKVAMDTMKNLYEGGFFGKFDKTIIEKGEDSKSAIEEAKKMQDAGIKHAQLQSQLLDWAKKNPAKAIDPQQVSEHFKSILTPEMQKAAEKEIIEIKGAGIFGFGGSLKQTPAWTQDVAVNVPTTNYTLGKSVGGPDEMEDSNTNQGHAAAGKGLLAPGVVAVNSGKYPLGTVFIDDSTGEAHIALDRHGNKNPDVIDFYQEPEKYQKGKGNRMLRVVGQAQFLPRNIKELRLLLKQYGKVPTGKAATEWLSEKESRALAKNSAAAREDVIPLPN